MGLPNPPLNNLQRQSFDLFKVPYIMGRHRKPKGYGCCGYQQVMGAYPFNISVAKILFPCITRGKIWLFPPDLRNVLFKVLRLLAKPWKAVQQRFEFFQGLLSDCLCGLNDLFHRTSLKYNDHNSHIMRDWSSRNLGGHAGPPLRFQFGAGLNPALTHKQPVYPIVGDL